MDAIIQRLAQELERPVHQVENVVHLIDEGNTIPFIARYRKELHGSMDDQLLRQLAERLQYLRNLEARKEEVRSAIEGQGKLNCRLKSALAAAETLAEVEDLYRPYKPKRRTRATIAREKGLAPLAELLSARGGAPVVPEEAAQAYVDPEKGVETIQDALQGASDILAEQISDDAVVRKKLRQQYLKRAMLVSKAADAEPKDSVYRLYYGFKCPVGKVQGYQTLAINRGEREGFLKVSVELDPESAHVTVRRAAVPGRACMDFVRAAADDAYDRLIQPSMEGDPQLPHRPGGRGGHPHVRPESEAPAHAAPGEGKGDHGSGPGLPHGVQGGGGGRHRPGAGHGGGLPHPREAPEGGGHRDPLQAGEEAPGAAHRHRQRHRQPGDRADDGGAHPPPGGKPAVHDRQRGGGLGVLRQQAGRRGVPPVRREPEKRGVHRPAAPSPGGSRTPWPSW